MNNGFLQNVKRTMLRSIDLFSFFSIFFVLALPAKDTFSPYTRADEVPQSATALWKSYDSKAEPLEVKVHHEWKEGGVVSRLVSFKVGTFKGAGARIAAYYCFPENGKKNPAFVWSHGGGQRADRRRGHYYASQGFATIDINWLGRPLEADLDPENKWGTDWGAVDPSQGPRFYSKALRKGWKRSLQADEYTIDPIASPRNANWFLLAVAARRAITFLEEQAEVDPERLGFTGFSMGGTITSMTATDPRLKAVAPFVGGTGFLHIDFPGIPRSSIGTHFKNPDLYQKTIDPSAYWPSVKCPIMFITSSNDFHSAFQRIYRSMDLLPHDNWRVTGNMHANHGPGPEQWILLNHWFKQHLAAEDKSIPVTPPSGFDIENGVAHFSVTPVAQDRLVEVEIYYSYDPNCVTRFWKKAPVKTDGKTWKADLNIHPKLPLYTFALCRYRLAQAEPLERGNTTSSFTLNSDLHTHIPEDIDLGAITRLPKTGLVDDFSNGILNWSSRDQSSIRTYKFQDPELDTSSERKLALTFNLKKDQPLLLRLGVDSKFLGNGRDLGSFNHGRRIEGDGPTTITLTPTDFKNKDGKALEWSRITTFSISLTDQKTKQKIKLAGSNARRFLTRIELVEDAENRILRVLSWNIWTADANYTKINEVIQTTGADVIGFQEQGNVGSVVSSLETATGEDWHSHGMIITRFPIIDTSGGGALIQITPEQTAWVFNVHFTAYPYQPYDLRDGTLAQNEAAVIAAAESTRGGQADSLVTAITNSGAMAAGIPVFVTGDFNEPSHLDWTQAAADATARPYDLKVEYPASKKMTDLGLTDTFRTIWSDELTRTGYTWTPGTPPPSVGANEVHDRIDFVYYWGTGVTAIDAVTVGIDDTNPNTDIAITAYPSDHRAVLGTFVLPKASE
jgi:dienelactone hydrolase/endonuclease/exonuclease/phosphatase family metal-dependent hydrolase